MITQFDDYTLLQQQTIEEYIGTFERRMMVFENFNSNKPVFDDFSNQSVKPYLKNLGTLIGEKVSTFHRVINSKSDFSYYMKTNGVIWDFSQSHGCQVWYFGFHGSPNGIKIQDEIITKEEILELLDGKFSDFPNILYFSSCLLFEDNDFGYELLKRSGTRGVFGFKNKIGFSISTLIDLFFLINFFKYDKGDPFDNLEEIFNNIKKGFPVSNEMGFTLYC